MPRRPLPIMPRGKRRRRVVRPVLLVMCPRVSPRYAMHALWALVKPQMKVLLEHQRAEQAWPARAAAAARDLVDDLARRLDLEAAVHVPDGGDFHLVIELPGTRRDEARALAVALSLRLAGLWFSLDRLHVLNGRFYRRQSRGKHTLVPARSIHLTRTLRSHVRAALAATAPLTST